jgi:glycosyltransferase involved in cell wall biosynthesis
MSPPPTSLRISVIVATRNRSNQIAECVRSILANQDADFELLVVDQSDAPAREPAMAAIGNDSRLRWVATDTRGLSASRNIGISTTSAPLIAFTDDDCRVPSDWVSRLRAAFAADAELSLLFGGVVLRSEDRVRGYAAQFEPKETREFQRALPDGRSPWGIGANMSIRRAVFDHIGMFDPLLGTGAPFSAAEEIDFTIRALIGGFKVLHTPSVAVVHLGVREGAAASHLMRGYGVGLGAALAKHIRLGTPGAARLLAKWLAFNGRRSIRNAIQGHRHPGFGLVAAVLWGACRSFGTGIDKTRRVFESAH